LPKKRFAEAYNIAAPHPQLEFVMSVVSRGIEHEGFSRDEICASVFLPQITVDQRWFQSTTVSLQWLQNLWNDHRFQSLEHILVFIIRPIAGNFSIEELFEQPCKVVTPIFIPVCVLSVGTMASDKVETKSPLGRSKYREESGEICPRHKVVARTTACTSQFLS
jgi:hypothetical protein